MFDKSEMPDMPSNEQLQAIMASFVVYMTSEDNPDDTLFLTLTQKEVALMGACLMLFKITAQESPLYKVMLDGIDALCLKVEQAMMTQKGVEGIGD
jgi:hypothetical protein